ncbi:cbb3-type cytochrome oxidase assembly protein CcoS [Marinimicrobium locisalis]|uniref:cbb3-type cytochrome oxidase assembly protein CcoS n=1 Tax=Marinimicrobium locisalis TaxID=546022 RepID=UPI00322175C5
MESLFLLVPIALIFVAIALKLFFWAIKSGQYDNLDTEAHRILFDEDENDAPAEPERKSDTDPSEPPK